MISSKEALKVLYEFAKEECETNSPELLRIIKARYNLILKELRTLEQYKNFEKNRNIDIFILFEALEEGFWVKEDCCFLKGDELERFKHKNSSYYDEENKLIFCPGAKADTDRVIHAKPSLAVTLLDGKITYYLSTPTACVLLEDYGKTWAFTKEKLK